MPISTDTVVEAFNAVKDFTFCLLTRDADSFFNEIALEAAKKEFRDGIIPTIISAIHAQTQTIS